MQNMVVETFVFNIADKVLGELGSSSIQKLCSAAGGWKREMEKLESTISTIRAVLLDAEEQQQKNFQLTNWLGKIKDALYDVEDVLVDLQYDHLQNPAGTRSGIKRKVREYVSGLFGVSLGDRIKEVREKLDEIAAEKAKFHLTERFIDRRIVHGEREMTHSFVCAWDVIGRDDDKEKIVQALMCPIDGEHVSVISIVGIGGLGKTTLAKLVYNDERVGRHFELQMWVCVSIEFDVVKLTREIIRSATGKRCDDLTIDQLQYFLRTILDDTKFLLVLDDVWNNDRGKWMQLRDLLLGGASGSKIVVTTRNQLVASIMSTITPHNLKGLPHKHSLSLFVKWAFKEGEEKQYPNLLKIGSEIVNKCKGVPLALRTLGSLLFSKTDELDWLFVKDNEIWKLEQKDNDILPALKLSYNEMSSYLKQCFVSCSMYPKDFVFTNYNLTQFWMAQGLLQSSNENQDWEAVGNRYIKELWSRSFFQDFEDCGTILFFKMHDLVHDLALFIGQSECLCINFHTHDISKSVRHVSFSGEDVYRKEVPRFLLEQNNLRTIFFTGGGVDPNRNSFVETCISKFGYLGVLKLIYLGLEALPSSIGNLKHLKYLDISWNHSIKKLPSSICKLKNLQTLSLFGCSGIEELPRDIGNLTNLRCLWLTTKQMFLPKEGIGSLNSLQFLGIIECPNLKSVGEWMQGLAMLRTLMINSCESLEEFLLCGKKYSTTLETLSIWNCENLSLKWEEDIRGPRSGLRSLCIGGLPLLVALPQWLQGAADTLQSIFISDCLNLTALPEWLQNLSSLQNFDITCCPKLTSLPVGMQRLTTLRQLKISACPELSRRCQREIGEDWPKIAHIPEIYLDEETSHECVRHQQYWMRHPHNKWRKRGND